LKSELPHMCFSRKHSNTDLCYLYQMMSKWVVIPESGLFLFRSSFICLRACLCTCVLNLVMFIVSFWCSTLLPPRKATHEHE
jgi:hypothetical protein